MILPENSINSAEDTFEYLWNSIDQKSEHFSNKYNVEKTTTEKIKLGLFVIIGPAFFVLAIYFIGSKQQMFGNTPHLKAIFDNVGGLSLCNNARYSGINIRTVRGIEMINDTTIAVDLVVGNSILLHIKKDAVATIASDS